MGALFLALLSDKEGRTAPDSELSFKSKHELARAVMRIRGVPIDSVNPARCIPKYIHKLRKELVRRGLVDAGVIQRGFGGYRLAVRRASLPELTLDA